jgi:hypothetical protein
MREANQEVMTTIRLGGNLVSFSEKYTIGLFEPQGRPVGHLLPQFQASKLI